MLQLSVELLLTCVVVILPAPLLFKVTVTFWQTALGRSVSATVTTELQLEVLPLLSVTVRVTLFAPVFAQLNVEGEIVVRATVQLSFEPLFTWDAVIVVFPLPLSCVVRFRQIAFGRRVSSTVTIPVQELEFPLWSVTETVTLLFPEFAQVKEVWEAVNETMVQLSVGNPAGGPPSEIVPEAFKNTVRF